MYTESVRVLQASLRYKANKKDVLCAQGMVHMAQQDPNAAVRTLSAAVKLDPMSVKVWSKLASIFLKTRDYEQALIASEVLFIHSVAALSDCGEACGCIGSR